MTSARISKSKKTESHDLTQIFESAEFADAYRISYLANTIVEPTYSHIKRDFGIIRAEYLLLLCLSHYAVLTAQDVSTLTRRPRNSISRAVQRMLKEGYVRRAPDPDDGRQLKLSISAEGRALHKRVAQYLVDRETELLEVLDQDERKAFRKTLQKLALHSATLSR